MLTKLTKVVRKENVYDQIRYPGHNLVRMNVQTWQSLGGHHKAGVTSGHMHEAILLPERPSS